MANGPQKVYEYEILLVKHYRTFMFGDIVDDLENYDWIDFAFFAVTIFMTLILFTNILIAYMGDAYTQVQETMDIC